MPMDGQPGAGSPAGAPPPGSAPPGLPPEQVQMAQAIQVMDGLSRAFQETARSNPATSSGLSKAIQGLQQAKSGITEAATAIRMGGAGQPMSPSQSPPL